MNDKELKFYSSLAGVNDLSRNRPCSEKTAKKEVDKFITLARHLREHLQSMHKPSFEALRRDGVCVPELLEHDLECAVLCADEQRKNMSGTVPTLGRPKKTQITTVMQLIVQLYESETGKRATRTNKEFKDYAEEKFRSLGLELRQSPRASGRCKTSVESQLKKLSRNSPKK
jgi:hypothetical protein